MYAPVVLKILLLVVTAPLLLAATNFQFLKALLSLPQSLTDGSFVVYRGGLFSIKDDGSWRKMYFVLRPKRASPDRSGRAEQWNWMVWNFQWRWL